MIAATLSLGYSHAGCHGMRSLHGAVTLQACIRHLIVLRTDASAQNHSLITRLPSNVVADH